MTEVIDLSVRFKERAHRVLVDALRDETQTRHRIINKVVDALKAEGLNPALVPALEELVVQVDAQLQFIYNDRIASAKKLAGIVDSVDVAHSIDWTAKVS